jgi:DNA-binding transcriptional regulator GbsR (MarR family)
MRDRFGHRIAGFGEIYESARDDVPEIQDFRCSEQTIRQGSTLFRFVVKIPPERWRQSLHVTMVPSDSSYTSEPSAPDAVSGSRRAETVDRFVEFWGQMASNWGINPTMARTYALLYCVDRPLNTDDIMERLQISRGSANMNLRSLVDWDLVEKESVSGSRKDHYRAEKDVWQVTARIIEERERREVRPVNERLRALAGDLVPPEATPDDLSGPERRLYKRLQNLIELMEVFEGVSEALLPLVKNRNEALIRQLISVAQSLDHSTAESAAPNDQ